MDNAAFPADLELIPDTLADVGAGLVAGLPGLAQLRPSDSALVLGMGSSRFAAEVVARRHRSAGARVTVESASTVVLPTGTGQTVVAVSATGESAEVLDAIERLPGATLVAVTNRVDSTLAARADVVVPLGAGVEAGGVACRTFRTTFPVLDAVLARLLGTPQTFSPEQLHRAAVTCRGLLDRRGQWLPPLAELAGGPQGVWFLAPVERLSSAGQGALMIREVPRRPAFASETGEWAHVDVYLTKTQDYRAVIFAGSRWDGQAAEWLRLRGSRFAVVGGEIEGAELHLDAGSDEVALFTEPLIGECLAALWA